MINEEKNGFFTFFFGEVQNNNFRSFIHVKYLRSVKKLIYVNFFRFSISGAGVGAGAGAGAAPWK